MNVENINGKLPQQVQKKLSSEGFAKACISSLASSKEKDLAKAVIDSIFSRFSDSEDYLDATSIKQIDLILGRTASLLDFKLDEFSISEKENVKACLLEILTKDQSVPNAIKDSVEHAVKKILNESFTSLKESIETLLQANKTQPSSDNQAQPQDKPKLAKKQDADETPKADEAEDDSVKETQSKEKDSSPKEKDDPPAESKFSKVKKLVTSATSKMLNRGSTAGESKGIKGLMPSKKAGLAGSKNGIDSLRAFIQDQFKKLNDNLASKITGNFMMTGKQRRSKKKKEKDNLNVNTLIEQISKTVKELNEFFLTIGEKLLQFLEKHIGRIAKILSKALKRLFKPIMELFWVTIGPPIMLIAAGVFLILAAVAKNLPLMADGIGRAMAVAATAIPILVSAIPKFLDLLLLIFDIVKRIVVFAIDELWPFIKDFFEWFKTEVYEPVLKPVLVWLATVFLQFFNDVILPLLEKLLTWFVDKVIPFITKYVAPVLAVILEILKEVLEAFKPWIKPFIDIIVSTLIDLFKIIKPVIIALAKFLADVFMDLLSGISAMYTFIKDKIIKPIWHFFTDVLPNFGKWLWSKIKALLPWGGSDTKKFELEDEKQTKSLSTIEDYKAENERLSNKIKELMSTAGSDDLNKALAKQKKKLASIRNETVKIDKGTVYDLLQLVNKINDSLVKVLSTAVNLLEKIVSYFSSTVSPEMYDESTTTDVSSISDQITTTTVSNITKTSDATNLSVKDLNENIPAIQKKNTASTEKQKTDVAKISDQTDVMDYLQTMFADILAKLDTPIPIPLPLGGTTIPNIASMENA